MPYLIGNLRAGYCNCISQDKNKDMNRLFLLFTLLCTGFFANAQFHNDVLPGMTGNSLRTELKDQYRPTILVAYDDQRDVLFGTVEKDQNDQVECIYTGRKVDIPAGQDPSSAAGLGGAATGLNAEHIYPQSKYVGGNTPTSDMHHLVPARADVNTDRSNNPYNEILDSAADKWYYLTQTTTSEPSANKDAYSEFVTGNFEPREEVKGDVARAMMYFYTMYNVECDAADPDFFFDQLDILKQWHELDPVDQKEWDRTWKVAQVQDNKPNPFVLDCSLVTRAFGGDVDAYCQSVPVEEIQENEIKVFPNPTTGNIRLEIQGEGTVQILDVSGKEISTHRFNSSLDWDFRQAGLTPGTYFIQITEGNKAPRVSKVVYLP